MDVREHGDAHAAEPIAREVGRTGPARATRGGASGPPGRAATTGRSTARGASRRRAGGREARDRPRRRRRRRRARLDRRRRIDRRDRPAGRRRARRPPPGSSAVADFQATSDPPARRAAGTPARRGRPAAPAARATTAGRSRCGTDGRSSARTGATWTTPAEPVAATAVSRNDAFLRDRLDEQRPRRTGARPRAGARGSRRRCRGRRTRGCPAPASTRRPVEAVDDVADRRCSSRVADRGQVDRRVPGEQEPDVAVDRPPARPCGQREPDRREAVVEGAVVLRREGGKAVDARRERVRRTVQAPLLSVVPVRAVRAPLPASSYVAPRSDPRSSAAGPVRGRVSPCPSPASLPQAVGADAGR